MTHKLPMSEHEFNATMDRLKRQNANRWLIRGLLSLLLGLVVMPVALWIANATYFMELFVAALAGTVLFTTLAVIFFLIGLVKHLGAPSRALVTATAESASRGAMAGELRTCPSCAEPIRAAAVRCRFCGQGVAPAQPNTLPQGPRPTGKQAAMIVDDHAHQVEPAFVQAIGGTAIGSGTQARVDVEPFAWLVARHRSRRPAIVIITAVVAICSVLGVLAFKRFRAGVSASEKAGAYSHYVDEVIAEPDKWLDRSFKLHGMVEPGSIHEAIVGQKTHRTFVLEHKGKRLMVRHAGPKPKAFNDLADVIAQGRLTLEDSDEGDAFYVFFAYDLAARWRP